MKLKYNVDIDDLVFFNLYHYETTKQIKKMTNKNRLIIAYSFIGISFIFYLNDIKYYNIFITFFGLISAFYCVRTRGVILRNLEKNIRNMYINEKEGDTLGRQELEILEDRLFNKCQDSDSNMYWEGITKAVYDGKRLLILIGTVKALIINKSSIIEGDIYDFIHELKKKIEVVEL